VTTIRAALIAFIAALACAGGATAGTVQEPTRFGVSDDYGKYADDSGAWFFEQMSGLGLSANKMTVNWDPSRPDVIAEQAFLDRAIPEAAKRGIDVSLGVHIGKARAITGSPDGAQKFAEFLVLLAQRYPEVSEIVVGNEPNLSRFWQPQFSSRGRGVSGVFYEAMLARSYDALKAVNPNITVVGLGLSPRGNGNPKAVSNISTQPVKFIHDVGRAYRASARDFPIMDVFGFHPYPSKDTDAISTGYPWPNAGIANLDRIKQAVWDAFHDTAQPTFDERLDAYGILGEKPAQRPLTFKLDEVGWQVAIPRASRGAYFGSESVKPTSESNQARIYRELVYRAACDPSVRELLFFGLVDERNLDRWQAGMIRVDHTLRPSYFAVKEAIADSAGRCMGQPVIWRHTEKVIGAGAGFRESTFTLNARATEDASYTAGLFRVSGAALSSSARDDIDRALAGRLGAAASSTRGALKAYWRTRVKIPWRTLPAGWYVQAIRLRAAMNPERTTLLVGRPFRIG
jgi:hypothetical protein